MGDRRGQLARLGTRPHLPAGLSRREAEVLRLIAQCLSNREIAKTLVISERTVARVVDIACGYGWSSLALAQAYPKVQVEGFDSDEDSITAASMAAAEAGLADRVSFATRKVTDLESVGTYDLVLVCNALHDMARPVETLQTMHALLAAGGTTITIEPRAPETFRVPGNPFDQLHYLESLLFCLPTGMAQQPSAATVQVMRPATLRRYAMEAGCRVVEILPLEHRRMRLYRLIP